MVVRTEQSLGQVSQRAVAAGADRWNVDICVSLEVRLYLACIDVVVCRVLGLQLNAVSDSQEIYGRDRTLWSSTWLSYGSAWAFSASWRSLPTCKSRSWTRPTSRCLALPGRIRTTPSIDLFCLRHSRLLGQECVPNATSVCDQYGAMPTSVCDRLLYFPVARCVGRRVGFIATSRMTELICRGAYPCRSKVRRDGFDRVEADNCK